MGVSLLDRKSQDIVFDANFWHYRAIIEAVRSLGVLPEDKVDALHQSWQDKGLTAKEARLVAASIRSQLLPTLAEEERLLLDGRRTTEPDDGVMHWGKEQHKNYSTNHRVLAEFADFCERCNGFTVC